MCQEALRSSNWKFIGKQQVEATTGQGARWEGEGEGRKKDSGGLKAGT